MTFDQRNQDCLGENTRLTSGDLKNILEVNKKAIEIHIEVEKQNEDILEMLKHCKTKVDEIDRTLFKLMIVLSSIGVGTIVTIIQLIIQK